MSTPRGYSSYHGRKAAGKIVLAVLLILVILAAAGFMALQKYIVYDASGTPHLLLPGESTSAVSSAQSSAAASSGDLNIQVDKPAVEKPKAIQLGETPLTDWNAVLAHLQMTPDTYDTAVLTMKDSSGAVYWNSTAAGAVGTQAVRADSGTAAAIAAMNQSDYHTVARISCFRDPVAAKADLDGRGLKNTGGYIFYDGSNENWMDPSKPATQEYLCALAKECADLGFDEILLTDFTYPTEGKLNKIDYGTTGKETALTACLTAIKGALADRNVRLSVELPADVLTTGSSEAAGLTLSTIAPLVDRIYAQTTVADASALSAAVTAASESTVFVPEVSETPTGDSYLVLNG